MPIGCWDAICSWLYFLCVPHCCPVLKHCDWKWEHPPPPCLLCLFLFLTIETWSSHKRVVKVLKWGDSAGHSVLFVLLCWEAAGYRLCIGDCQNARLQQTSWSEVKRRHFIPVWLCCVVLKAGLFCGSVTWHYWFKKEKKNPFNGKKWYCTEVLEKCWNLNKIFSPATFMCCFFVYNYTIATAKSPLIQFWPLSNMKLWHWRAPHNSCWIKI